MKILIVTLMILMSVYAISFLSWGLHVNGKFNRYAKSWEKAWRIDHDEKAAWRYYHAEEKAHNDMFNFVPLYWIKNWKKDYLEA